MKRIHTLSAALLAAGTVLCAQYARAQEEEAPQVGPPPPPTQPEAEAQEAPPAEETPPVGAPTPAPPTPVLEAPAPRFGSAGVTLITSAAAIGASSTTFESSAASSTNIAFSPGIDYFIARHFSVGLDLTIAYEQNRSYGADSSLVQTRATTLAMGPRIGFDVSLGRSVSWYPRFTFGMSSQEREREVLSGRSASTAGSPFGALSTSTSGPFVSIFAPLLLHPAPHFFVGAGPSLFHDFAKPAGSKDGERTTIGGRIVLGAWWGGTSEGAAVEVPATTPAETPRFGDSQQLVLTGEAGASVYSTSFTGTTSTTTTVNVSPGLDYFVSPQVSLGLSVSGSYAKQSGSQPSGESVSYDSAGFSVAPRVGYNVPLTSSLSFYPRALTSVGFRSYDLTSGRAQNSSKTTFVAVGLYAPLLVHFSSHAFFGFGPYVARDLMNKAADGGVRPQVLATSYGVSLIVGAWL